MQPEDLACRELVELVTEYLDEALTPEERARFEQHLRACEGCSAYLDEVRETIRLTGRLEPESLSERARKALRVAFRTSRTG